MEEGEVHFAVGAVLHEVGQVAEVVGARVLDDKQRARVHQCAVHYQLGQLGQALQVVGRVGKDDVVTLLARRDKSKYVALDKRHLTLAKLLLHLADEVILRRRLLDARHMRAAARDKLKTHRARAGKEVEGRHAVEVDYISQHVEEVLARHVGGGPRGDVGGHVEAASPIFSGDYSHKASINKFRGASMAFDPSCSSAAGMIAGTT